MHLSEYKRPRLESENASGRQLKPSVAVPHSTSTLQAYQNDLVMMLLDIEEQPHGCFHLWGVTSEHKTVLVKVRSHILVSKESPQRIQVPRTLP